MAFTVGALLPPNLDPVTFQMATRADPTSFAGTVYTAIPLASRSTWYTFSTNVAAGDYLVKQLQSPYFTQYVRLSGSTTVLHFETEDDMVRYDALNTSIEGVSVIVLPSSAVSNRRVKGTDWNFFTGETGTFSVSIYNASKEAVDLSGTTLEVVFEDTAGTDIAVVENADITVSGADSNVVSFSIPSALTSEERNGDSSAIYSLRDTGDGNMVIAHGRAIVKNTATSD
jgi:hypothetical protein